MFLQSEVEVLKRQRKFGSQPIPAERTEYSSVGRAFDCRLRRYRMVPGSIPGRRIFFPIATNNDTILGPVGHRGHSELDTKRNGIRFSAAALV